MELLLIFFLSPLDQGIFSDMLLLPPMFSVSVKHSITHLPEDIKVHVKIITWMNLRIVDLEEITGMIWSCGLIFYNVVENQLQ